MVLEEILNVAGNFLISDMPEIFNYLRSNEAAFASRDSTLLAAIIAGLCQSEGSRTTVSWVSKRVFFEMRYS